MAVEPLKDDAPAKNAGLFIGINEFTADQEIHPLEFAVNDALSLAYLTVVELKLIPGKHCFLCLSGEPTADRKEHLEKLRSLGATISERATKAEILLALEKLKKVVDTTSLITVSVSSHGLVGPDDVPYVIPSDGLRNVLEETALKLNTIEQALEGTEAAHRLMLIDACQERMSLKSVGGTSPASAMKSGFAKALEKKTGQIKVASCKPGEFSFEDRKAQQGVFTEALLQALRGQAAPRPSDNIVDLEAVLEAAKATLAQRPMRERQTLFVHGEEAARKMPLAIRASDMGQLLATLKRKVSTQPGGFSLETYEKLAARLPRLDSSNVADQELLEATREFAAGRFKEFAFVLVLRDRLMASAPAKPGMSEKPVAGKPTPSKPAAPATSPSETAATESGNVTEAFSEDFRTAANMELPEGWVNLDTSKLLAVRQDGGRSHLRTKFAAYNWDESGVLGGEDLSTVRLPPTSVAGDFSLELTVLSNDPWNPNGDGRKVRTMTVTLKQKEEKLICRCFEHQSGLFVCSLSGSDESKSFTWAGKTPYRWRLERKAGTYRVTNNAKVLLTHVANDQREFDVCELELSPKVMVGSIKIAPLNDETSKSGTPQKR